MNIDGTRSNSASNAFKMTVSKPAETKFVDELPLKVSQFQPHTAEKTSARQSRPKTVRTLGNTSKSGTTAAPLAKSFRQNPNPYIASVNETTVPRPTETKIVDKLPSRASQFQPNSPGKTSARQSRPKTVRPLGDASRAATTAAPNAVRLHQTPGRHTQFDAAPINRTMVSKPAETKFVDELPHKASQFQPTSPVRTSARQSPSKVSEAVEISSRVAPPAAPKALNADQNRNIQAVSPTALVKSSMVEKKVSKNNHDWKIGQHVDAETIAKITPEENIADGEDTVFLDQEGNFVCSIAYDAIDVPDNAIDVLAPLPRSNCERGPAAGPVDREVMDRKYEAQNEQKKSSQMASERDKCNQWLQYPEDKPWMAYLNGDKNKKRGNSQFSTSFGCSRRYRIPAEVESSTDDKSGRYKIVKPYFKLISDCFEKKWNDKYRSYTQRMKENGGDNLYLADSVFSSIVVNTHEIDGNGEVSKNARAAIHTDSGHHDDSFEVMLCLTKNIEGGDLYLPEYGILLKLRHRCVVCFRAKLHKHAVTEIKRKDLHSKALRVTLVAYMTRFAEDTLQKARQSSRDNHQPVSQSLSQKIMTSDFDEEGGEEESEPMLEKNAAKEGGSGILNPCDHKSAATHHFLENAMKYGPLPQAASPTSFQLPNQGPFYIQLAGTNSNPIQGLVPIQAPHHLGANFPQVNQQVTPAYGGGEHAQKIQSLQEQLLKSRKEQELLEKEIYAMRASVALFQACQQPFFSSEEFSDEFLSHAPSTVWLPETPIFSEDTENRGIKRSNSALNPSEPSGYMPPEKRANCQKR